MVWPPAIGMPARVQTDSPPSRILRREERLPAHGVHVGDGVGRCDGAEVERIVHDRHEEVGGRDDRLAIVDAVDGRVVAGFDAHQQVLRDEAGRGLGEDLLQHAGSDLAAAPAAVTELGEANLHVHRNGPFECFQCEFYRRRQSRSAPTTLRIARASLAGENSGRRAKHPDWRWRMKSRLSSACTRQRANPDSSPASKNPA